MTYTLTDELQGDLYRRVMAYAFEDGCLFALLVVRPDLDLSDAGRFVLTRLAADQHDVRELAEWPGTCLVYGTATVYRFRITKRSVSLLAQVDGLYSWRQPQLPEDLCILRAEDEPWLVSIAHERDSYLTLSNTERLRLLRAIPELSARLVVEP